MHGRGEAAAPGCDGAVLLGEGVAGEAQGRLVDHLREAWGIDLVGPPRTGSRWRERATIAAEGAFFAACIGVASAVVMARVAAFALREALR